MVYKWGSEAGRAQADRTWGALLCWCIPPCFSSAMEGVSGSEPVWPWLPPDLTRARLQRVPGWALNQPRTSEYEGGTANLPWAASLGKGRSQDDKCAPGDGYPGLFCELLIACQCWSPSRARGGSSSCLVANCCVCSLVASRQSWHAKSRICWREGRPPFHPYGLGRQ